MVSNIIDNTRDGHAKQQILQHKSLQDDLLNDQ